jgi:CheY-like chemotaxis protein
MGHVTAPAPDAGSESCPSRRVLLVDDNTDAAETLAILLEAVGHRVTVAHTGLEAITVAQQLLPEVVLLDIGLPDISGLEVCRALRESEATRRARIVALTGWGQAEDRRQTSEAQFDLHLVKPVHPSLIRKMLAEMP